MKKLSTAIVLLLIAIFISSVYSKSSYRVTRAEQNLTTITLSLAYTGQDDYYVKPSSPISKSLTFVFHTLTFQDFYFKFVDPNNKRFEVPQTGIFPIDPFANFSFPIAAAGVRFEYT